MNNKKIIFKFWDAKKNEMTISRTLKEWIDAFAQYEYDTKSNGNHLLDSLIELQYTGINDMSGNPIFEGDIVEKKTYPTRQIVVEFKNGKYNISDYVISKLKVIGNIYEHTHLISKQL